MTAKASGKKKTMLKIRKYWPLFVMTLPGVIYFIINNYVPMYGLTIAFREVDYAKGIFSGDWVGLKNFEFLFKTKDAWNITRNTLLYNGVFIILNTVLALMLAIMLNEVRIRVVQRFCQTVVLLPYLISIIIVAYLLYAFLAEDTGYINSVILPALGKDKISWYTTPKYWPVILVLVNAWKNVGYLTIVYFASVIGIDSQFYEAAKLDGATNWQLITRITLPAIAPTICTMVLLSIGRIFYSDFGLFYQVPMNSGPLVGVTNVMDTYVYRGLMQLNDIGMSSAASAYQSIIGCILVVIANLVVKKFNPDNALV
ncbi:MAG: ABC transporter permease subunit [Eubacteriales bacterium]|nr:ABC transporter permease subunit [Eubacteriales bacterium]